MQDSRLLMLATVLFAVVFSGMGATAQSVFRDVTEQAGLVDPGSERGVAWGDYDGDGAPDFFVAVLDGPDRLYRNQGGFRFIEVSEEVGLASPAGSAAASWCDFDGDGDLDLFLARIQENHLYRNDDGVFVEIGAKAGLEGSEVSWGAAWADYDRDGLPDLFVANFGVYPNQLYHNLGAGRFEEVAEALGVDHAGQGTSATWGDYDGDGDPDLYVANKSGANLLYRNEGGHSFTERASIAGVLATGKSIGSAWGDADGDGDLDLFLSQASEKDLLFLNQGNGQFLIASQAGLGDPGEGRGIGLGDTDNDGDLDLYVARSIGKNLLYQNDGWGRFTDISTGSGVDDAGTGTAMAWADMDGDGDLDLLLSNFGRRLRLFENIQESGNHWLAVDLRSDGPNSHGLGAVVRVHTANRVLTRHQTTGGGGYQSQAPHRIHFGLGGSALIDSVTVHWPSGIVSRLAACQADGLVLITDP